MAHRHSLGFPDLHTTILSEVLANRALDPIINLILACLSNLFAQLDEMFLAWKSTKAESSDAPQPKSRRARVARAATPVLRPYSVQTTPRRPPSIRPSLQATGPPQRREKAPWTATPTHVKNVAKS